MSFVHKMELTSWHVRMIIKSSSASLRLGSDGTSQIYIYLYPLLFPQVAIQKWICLRCVTKLFCKIISYRFCEKFDFLPCFHYDFDEILDWFMIVVDLCWVIRLLYCAKDSIGLLPSSRLITPREKLSHHSIFFSLSSSMFLSKRDFFYN